MFKLEDQHRIDHFNNQIQLKIKLVQDDYLFKKKYLTELQMKVADASDQLNILTIQRDQKYHLKVGVQKKKETAKAVLTSKLISQFNSLQQKMEIEQRNLINVIYILFEYLLSDVENRMNKSVTSNIKPIKDEIEIYKKILNSFKNN
jgi:hypothetical protein